MPSPLSEMIITKIHAFNRINTFEGSTGGSINPRERSAIAIKTEGCTEYRSEQLTVRTDSTHAILLPKGSTYSWKCLHKGECLMIEFDAENISRSICPLKVKNISEISSVFGRLENIMIFRKPAYTVKCLHGIYDIIVKLCDADSSDYSLVSKKAKIEKSVDYLEKHCLTDDMNIESLARLSGISSVYFRKIFTELYGISPMQYVNSIRIEKAKGMLLGGYGSVTEISFLSGFGSVYHFCKAFKRATGLTPTEWAKSVHDR